ncbi:PP2C family protein-serine/threonine phosphatase [Sporosarcina thermotolerans]|uniref:PP2C family protein-serine/threonine phosphatase n=1 Tax=Sporosarcina thermotolerans TaxID=633404 RepID=A0AAW9AFW0_9BACL|nr:PP2C family protein-serine/threonine phosphatase [Sporosarcina thermotolerans]MDW0118068.1 PP2C family protein-serine/threonine phosphatase [Sporosarcina thermotolerans]WHT49122.1 PP2C family protein-serine/threonine phosphatase [Sporosarcina thermotolerans]
MPQVVGRQYKEILKKYLESHSEEDLYVGQQFSRRFIEKEIAPEDVISIHKSALLELHPELQDEVWDSLDFLIEMMIHYGFTLRERQSLIRKQEVIQMEMNVATKVQNTLLKTESPIVEGLDVGWISEPARQMNGDYVHFLNREHESSVAVADVMGKGIPAALCMSMIKFGMDGLPGENSSPGNALSIINRIVEKSVDDSMFISMFYGKYDSKERIFSYASAGHEPAWHFNSDTETFSELDAKGLLLGVKVDSAYEERSVSMQQGDFIVMMTDGVTESRTEEGFVEMKTIQNLLVEVKDKSAREIAEYVYKSLAEIQNYKLSDDFTIVIFKKN